METPTSSPPKDVPVITAFSKQKAACEGQTEWTLDAGTKDWIDISTDWGAIDTATAQDNVRNINVEQRLDGVVIAESMKYPQAPEPFSITCGDTTYKGSEIRYALFLPPLSPGGHIISWHISILEKINDGWNDYPKGIELSFTATVKVQ